MNIEIANRLIELRKKSGLSQEELAAKLGLSRQAVSKWERAEASPDTDNLICLAKLYGVSLDELLNTDESIDEIVKEQIKPEASDAPSGASKDETAPKEDTSSENKEENTGESKDGSSSSKNESANEQDPPKKDHEEVHIDSTGIHFKDGEDEGSIDAHGIHVFTHGKKKNYDFCFSSKAGKRHRVYSLFEEIGTPLVTFLSVAAYLCLGFFYPDSYIGWGVSWLVLLAIPLYSTFIEALRKRSFCAFAFPVLVAGIYLLMGLYWGMWHPYWVIFLTIPAYYVVFSPIDKVIRRHWEDEFEEDDKDNEDENEKKKQDAIDVGININDKKK